MLAELDAAFDVLLAAADDFVEESAGLARVARDFRHAFLVAVEFLEGGHRNVDIVFLEAEQTGGIVHQHIGVKHEELDVGGQARHCGSGFTLGHGWRWVMGNG